MEDWKCFHKNNVSVLICCVVVSIPFIISGIVIGAVYFDDCPSEPYIPIFLIVVNAAHSFFGLLLLLQTYCDFEDCKAKWMMALICLVGVFIGVWHVAGWKWVFLGLTYDCSITLYIYTFTTEIIFMFLMVHFGVVFVIHLMSDDNTIDVV